MENLDDLNLDDTILNQGVSQRAQNFLNKASGWVKAVAILGIIGGSLGIISGVFSLFFSPVASLLYLLVYGGFIYISILLLKISTYSDAGSFNIEEFAENFYKYWKYLVIYIIISFAVGMIGVFVLISIGGSLFNGW